MQQKKQNGVTKNLADYMALNDGLRIVQHLSGSKSPRVELQTSNDTVSKHLNGQYRVSSKLLLPWYEKVCKLAGGGVVTVKVDRTITKLAKQNAMYAIKGRESDQNFKSAMQSMAKTPQRQDLVEQNPPPSPDVMLTNDKLELEKESSPKSYQQSNGHELTEKSNSQTVSAEISAEKTYILRFDGGSRGNPGVAGSGMVLYDSEDGSEIWSGCQYLGDYMTNNEAEYAGLITGLQCARSLGIKNIVAQGDSKLILHQVEGKWKVKAAHLMQYYDEALSLSKEFESFQTYHIERARNARADELANEAMDTKESRGFHIE